MLTSHSGRSRPCSASSLAQSSRCNYSRLEKALQLTEFLNPHGNTRVRNLWLGNTLHVRRVMTWMRVDPERFSLWFPNACALSTSVRLAHLRSREELLLEKLALRLQLMALHAKRIPPATPQSQRNLEEVGPSQFQKHCLRAYTPALAKHSAASRSASTECSGTSSRCGLAINSRFKDHFIVRVPDLRPPEEMYLDWLYQCRKLCQEFVNRIRRETVS
jgi:hypothetical protein